MLCSKLLRMFSAPFHRTVSIQPQKYYSRRPSSCDICLVPYDKRPCFDLGKITIERGNDCHAKFIKSFLYTHYWPREPSVVGLWMDLNCEYLKTLTEKYSTTGDRLIAFEHLKRTNERKMIGCSISNRIYPWQADELEEWAHYTDSKPERNRMYFIAHCLRSPNLFKKYKTDYIYEVEVIATASEVSGHGVGTSLLRAALDHAQDTRYPLVVVIAVSHYTAKLCAKCGMKKEWSMDYADYVDGSGLSVFFPRRPHTEVSIYTKLFDLRKPRGP